jgi:ABC-type glycerol-3-phosphate transport system substrate-binding protein
LCFIGYVLTDFIMKNKFLVGVLLFSLLLSGCLPQTEDDSNVLSGDTQKIIVWGLYEDEQIMKSLIDAFEDNNPDVDIEYTKWNKDEYFPRIVGVLQDGNPNTTPDIFMIHNTWVGNYSSYIANAPSSIFSYDDYSNEFHDFLMQDFGYDNTVRGVPLWVDMLGLVYHKPYLIESGNTTVATNWNDFMKQAVALTKTDEDGNITRAGFSAGQMENVEFSFEILNLLMLQSRNQPFTKDTLGIPYAENEVDSVKEAFVFYKSFGQGDNPTWNGSLKLDTALFIEGKLSSVILPTWRILDVLAYDKDRGLNLDLGTTQVPQLNPETLPPVTYPTYWGFVVAKDSTKVNRSWDFLRYLSTKQTQEKYMELQIASGRPFPMISPRKDLLNVYSEYPLLKSYIDSIPNAYSWYMINGTKLRQVYTDFLEGRGEIEDINNEFVDIEQNKNVI